MASFTSNAFDLLNESNGDGWSTSTSKKKNRNRKKKAAASAEATSAEPSSAAPPAPAGQRAQAAANGEAQSGAVFSAPKQSREASTARVADTVSRLEASWKTAGTASDRAKLMQEWCKQMADASAAYTTPSGDRESFKEVFLRTTLLSDMVSSVASEPLSGSAQADFLFLVGECVSDQLHARALGNTAIELGGSLQDAEHVDRQAVANAVWSTADVLRGSSYNRTLGLNEGVQRSIAQLDRDAAEKESRLHSLEQGNGTLGERVKCANELLKIRQAKMDSMFKGSVASGSQTETAFRPSTSFETAKSYIQIVHDTATKQLSGFARQRQALEGERGAALSALTSEERELAAEKAQLLSHIASLEEQLKTLRYSLETIESRHQQIEAERKSITSGHSNRKAAAEEIHKAEGPLRKRLELVQRLDQVLTTSRGEPLEGQGDSSAVVELLNALRLSLEYKRQQQVSIHERLAFCLSKMAPVKKDEEELKRLGYNDLVGDLAKPKQQLMKMKNEIVAAAEEVDREVTVARGTYNKYVPLLGSSSSGASSRVAIESLIDMIKAQHETIMTEAAEEKIITSTSRGTGADGITCDAVLDLLKGAKLEADTKQVEGNGKTRQMEKEAPVPAERPAVVPTRAEHKPAAPRGWARLQTDSSVSNESNGPTLQQAYGPGGKGDKDKFSLFSLPGFSSPGTEPSVGEGKSEE